MERFKWFTKKHWWKILPLAAVSYFAVQWLFSGTVAGSQNMGLGELENAVNHGQIRQVTIRTEDHDVKVTLADNGPTCKVTDPAQLDLLLTAGRSLLLTRGGIKVDDARS